MPGQRDGAINALEHALHGAATETRKRRSAPMKKCNALTMKRVFGLQCLLSSERVPLLFTRSSLIRRADLARFSSLQVDARTRKPFLICSDNENKKNSQERKNSDHHNLDDWRRVDKALFFGRRSCRCFCWRCRLHSDELPDGGAARGVGCGAGVEEERR